MTSRFELPANPAYSVDALDIGAMATAHLMSDELVAKIQAVKNKRVQLGWNELDTLQAQIKEYAGIYTLDNTLSVLSFLSGTEHKETSLLNQVTHTLQQLFKMDVCHLFLENDAKQFQQAGGTYALTADAVSTYFEASYGQQLLKTLRDTSEVTSYTNATLNTWKSSPEENYFYNAPLQYAVVLPLYNAKGLFGFVLLGSQNSETALNQKQVDFAKATRLLLTQSLGLQNNLNRYSQIESIGEDSLRQYRNELSEAVANLNQTQQWFVNALCVAIDANHHYTEGHSKGVAKLVKAMSEALGLNEKTVDLLHQAALVSVIGKLAVTYAPTDYAFPLYFNETHKKDYNLLLANAADFLRQMNFASDVIPYVQYQQAQWDGEGTPSGLSGLSIPLGSRILGLSNAYWALRHERPYRNQVYSQNEALDILSQEAGMKWDPSLVELLEQIVSLANW